jgi:hypothetical protein
MKFLCRKKPVFLEDYSECEKCSEKETCVNYKYEIEYQKRRAKEKLENEQIETAKLEQHLDFVKSMTVKPDEWLKEETEKGGEE